MRLPRQISLGRAALAAAPLVALAVVFATPQLAGRQLVGAWSHLAAASPLWLWLALAGFLASVLSTAFAWRAALRAAGARLGRFETAARYGVGCLVNSFAPGGVGGAVRVALLAQRLEGPDPLWTTGGAAVSVGVVRGITLALLVVAASATGALPLWPVLVLCGGVAIAAGVAWALWRRRQAGRVGRFLGGFTALLRSPRSAAAVLGWSAGSQAARLGATAAVAAALAVPHPLLAALVIVPTLQLMSLLPVTPGALGLASGAVALALETRGVHLSQALATGIAYHATETIGGVAFGAASTLAVVEVPPLARRAATVGAAVAVAVGLGVTVLRLV